MPRCPFQFLLPFPAGRQLLRPRHCATKLRPSAIFQAWCLRHLPSPLRRRLLCLRCRLQILLHLRRHLRYRSPFHHRGHRRVPSLRPFPRPPPRPPLERMLSAARIICSILFGSSKKSLNFSPAAPSTFCVSCAATLIPATEESSAT